jgi:hypothetical protein
MLHATALAFLLGLAAATLETTVRRRDRPVRGLWIAAGLGTVLLSALPMLLPERGSALDVRLIPAPALDAAARLPWPRAYPGSATPFDAEPWLLAMWGIASAAVAVWIAISHARLRRRQTEWVPREVDGRGVWVSADTGPAVVGVLRGRIVLPEWVLERDAGERSLVLAHEEEHVRAHDPRLLFGALLVLAALPWNLPLWWQWRRLRQAVELDCDRRVLARAPDPRAYGRLLVDVAQLGTAHRLIVAALSESPSFLERRLSLMLSSRPRRWKIRATVSTFSASLLVAAACSMNRPAAPAAERLTLWVSPGGAYHLRTPESAPIPQPQLGAALRTALSRTADPSVLNVGVYKGAGGYDYLMMRQAACEAGVTRLDVAVEIPAGSRDASAAPPEMRSWEDIQATCARLRASAVRPDTAMSRVRTPEQ